MIQILLGLMALCVLFFLVVIIRDVNRFVTVEYRIPCRGLKKGCCFVMLSDLHNKQFGEHNSRLLEAVEECRPDGVLIAGDMLTSQVSGSFAPALETVSALAEKYPVYYANGNHEYRVKSSCAGREWCSWKMRAFYCRKRESGFPAWKSIWIIIRSFAKV